MWNANALEDPEYPRRWVVLLSASPCSSLWVYCVDVGGLCTGHTPRAMTRKYRPTVAHDRCSTTRRSTTEKLCESILQILTGVVALDSAACDLILRSERLRGLVLFSVQQLAPVSRWAIAIACYFCGLYEDNLNVKKSGFFISLMGVG